LRFPGGGRMGLKAFLKRLYEEYENDSVADCAASLSYYFLFSLFPFLFFLTTLTAFIPYIRQSVETILERAHAILPGPAMGVIEPHVRGLVARPRPHLLTLGLLATLYSASRGVDAVRKALNLAYDVKESRKWWRTELDAFGMTIGGALLVLIAIARFSTLAMSPAALFDNANDCMMPVMLNAIATTAANVSSSIAVRPG